MDVAKSYGVGLAITLLLLFLVVGLARWSPQWWWTVGAASGAVLVVAVSFAYPVVVEPVFNKFTSLPAGQLRTSLLALAEADGVPVKDVLVADASRRTSSLNAYVSGFGSTRRVVVYDTLLDSASDREIELIVAHELGHAERRDVVWGTLLGRGGRGPAGLPAGAGRPVGTRCSSWAEVSPLGDGRAIALALAVLAVLGFVSGPGQALISRRIETRADVHALDLTRDPGSMIAMQQRLSTTNLSDLDPSPLVFGMFSTHPTAPSADRAGPDVGAACNDVDVAAGDRGRAVSARTLVVTNDFPPRVGGIESFVLAMVQRMPADSVVVHTARQHGDAAFDAGLHVPGGARPVAADGAHPVDHAAGRSTSRATWAASRCGSVRRRRWA